MSAYPKLKLAIQRIFFNRITVTAAIILVIYSLAGFFLAPYLVKRYVPRLAQEHLQCDAHIGEVRINPFVFTFQVDNFSLTETDGTPLTGFKRFFVDFEASSILRWAWTFRRIEFVEPTINVVIAPDGGLNFSRLVPKSSQPPKNGDVKPPRLMLFTLAVQSGEIALTDRRQSTPANVTIHPLNLELRDVSTLPERKGPYTLSATASDGGVIKWDGEIFLHPLRSSGSLAFDNIKADTLWQFFRDTFNLAPPGGRLALQSAYRVDLSQPEPHIALDDFGLRFSDLSLKLAGASAPFLELDDIDLGGGHFDLATRRAEVGHLSLDRGSVTAAVDPGKELNLQRIVKKAAGAGADASAPRTMVASERAADESHRPWQVRIAAVKVRGVALDYRDASRSPALEAGISTIGIDCDVNVEAAADKTDVIIGGIAADFDKIETGLAGAPEPAIRVDKISLADGAFDLGKRLLTFLRIGLDGGHIDLSRESDGAINLAALLAPAESGALKRGAEPYVVEDSPWQFGVNTIELAGFTAKVNDRTVKVDGPLLNLQPLNLRLSNVDGKSPTDFELDVKIREGGSVRVSGRADPAGPTIEARVNAADVALIPFQPYIAAVANVVMHSGLFSSAGLLRYGTKADGAEVAFDGGFNLSRLRLTESGSKETLLGWKALKTDQLTLRLKPDRLDIKELRLVSPTGKLVIGEDGSINLAKVIKPPKREPGAPARAASSSKGADGAFPVRIQKLSVDQGVLDFADLNLKPQFGTKINELKGSVIGASSAPDARAQVQLAGNVDEYGEAKIGGEINMFDPKSFTDIKMVFNNVEMMNLTPYSGKFAGRKIDSGKLSLDLAYKIDDGKLAGDNQIVVERLKLGDRMESPEAVNLPLDLAVALLEDADGVIDIGLPVSGDLNDPEFSFGHLVWKALANLITKVVTSPFRALAALAGGESENFDSVAFEPGAAALAPPQKEVLKKLAEALKKRPQLILEVQGRYSTEVDGLELKNLYLRRELSERLGATPETGEDPGPVDFSSPDTQRALEAMVAERFGTSTLKALKDEVKKQSAAAAAGTAQAKEKAPDPGRLSKELYARLVEKEPLPEAALTELAAARAQSIVVELTATGGVAPERVSLKNPEPVTSGEPATAKLFLVVAQKSP
ncbi:MAG: DUF748 domain-containing protein [Desulfobacterales bacterium]